MTTAEFADALSRLVGAAEDAGLEPEQALAELEGMTAAMRLCVESEPHPIVHRTFTASRYRVGQELPEEILAVPPSGSPDLARLTLRLRVARLATVAAVGTWH